MSAPKRPELVSGWLERARSDFQLGRVALTTPGVMCEDACFHAQQSAEKSLKALLTYLDIDFPRTHVLEVLLDLLKANGINVPGIVDEAFELTQYAVQTRYPGEWEPVTQEEAKIALERASVVLNWVQAEMKR
jgi:HEPN domain-containing protein